MNFYIILAIKFHCNQQTQCKDIFVFVFLTFSDMHFIRYLLFLHRLHRGSQFWLNCGSLFSATTLSIYFISWKTSITDLYCVRIQDMWDTLLNIVLGICSVSPPVTECQYSHSWLLSFFLLPHSPFLRTTEEFLSSQRWKVISMSWMQWCGLHNASKVLLPVFICLYLSIYLSNRTVGCQFIPPPCWDLTFRLWRPKQ